MRLPEALLTRWFGIALAHAVVVQAVTFVLRPMTAYRAIDLGVGDQFLGAFAAAFAVAPLVLAVPAGRFTDRLGERPVIIVGAFLLVGSAACFIVAGDTVPGLVAATIILGTGQLLSVVGSQAIIANLTATRDLDQAFGQYTFAASLGQTAGPILLILVAGRGTIPASTPVFLTGAILALVVLVLALGLRVPGHAHPEIAPSSSSLRDVARIPGLVRALFAAAVILSAVDVLIIYLPALGASAGMSAAAIGLLLALRSGSSMVSRLYLGRVTARLGRRPFLIGSTLAAAASVAIVAFPLPIPILAAAVAVAGFGLGVGQPLTMSWLAEVAPAGLRGTALSLRITGNRLGQIILPTAAGLIAGGAGAQGVLALTGVTLVAAAVATRSGGIARPET